MYNTTKAFEEAIFGDNRQFKAKIKSGKNETESGIISINLYSKTTDSSITIGGAVSTYVEVQMWKPDFYIENVELEISIGMVLSEENEEWVPLGLFTTERPKNDNGVVTFTAYDRVQSKMYGAFFSELTYPIDAKKVLEEISSKTGVPIDVSNLSDGVLISQRKVISESDVDQEGNQKETTTYENPFNGYTYRETLGYIAMLFGKFAMADKNGVIVFKGYESTEYLVDTSKYFDDLVTQDIIFSIEKIECTVEKNLISSGEGTTSISLVNPVMTQERLDYIYDQIKDLKFLPASISFYGDIRLDLGDIITVNDKEGNVIKIPLMSIQQEYDGGLLTRIQSYGKAEENTQSGGQLTKIVNRTYTELFLVKEIIGEKASFEYVHSKVGEFEELFSKTLTADQADIKYAKIDMANVNNAWIENGYIKKGSITNAEIKDATIEAAKIASINADTINSGTIKTERLIIVSDDGTESIVSVINSANGVPEGEVNSKKIQAASIDVLDLSAFRAKIAGFKLEDYAIYADKESVTEKNGEMYLSTDRFFLGIGAIDNDQNTAFQAYANGSFRLIGKNSKFEFNTVSGSLDMAVTSLKISSKSVVTSDEIDDVKDSLKDYVPLSTYKSYIEKTDKTITLLAKQETVDAMNQRLSTAESTIKQFPDRIELKVDKDGIISAINQSAETVKITAGKIDLSGYVTVSALSGNGTTTIDGSNIKTGTISADRLDIDSIFAKDITATGSITGVTLNGATGSFDGRITASEGIIGGFYINENSLYSNKLVNNIQIHPLVIDNDGITCYGTYGYAYVKDGRIDLEHTMTTPIHAIGSLILSSDALGIQGSFTDQDHPEASSGFSISLDGDASFTNVQAPVELPDNGTNWIGGMTSTSCIVAPQQSSNLYHPVLRINSESNNVWNIGGYKDRVGIYGFKAERTANGYDFSTEWNTANGALSHSASFSAKGTITTESGDLVMGVGRSLRAKDEEGTTWNLIAMNEDSNISVGYGGYSMNYGTTTIYAGEKIGFVLSLPETSWRPYFTEGDSVSIQFGTAGFTHNSGKSVTFVIPIAKPLVGVKTIVVTSVGGLTVRQENKLLYGATSSAGAKPASYAANAIHTHMGIKVTATMSNATNAMNNAPCGVYVSVKITFN